MGSQHPPALARLFARLCVGGSRGESVLQELDLEYRDAICPSHAPRHARRWYRREAMSLARWYVRHRLSRLIPTRPRVRILSPRPTDMLSDLLHDSRMALRALRSQPVFSAVSIGTLAIGIGATAAIFSIVDTVLLRPLPYVDSDRLVRVWTTDEEDGERFVEASIDDFEAFRDRSRGLDTVAAFSLVRRNLADARSTPTQVVVARSSEGLLQTLGVRPALGRLFTNQEHRDGLPVAVLSFDIWQRRYGGDTEILGERIEIEQEPHSVIGVLPAAQGYPREAMLWRPFTRAEQAYRDDDRELYVVGRLSAGTTLEGLDAELAAIAKQLEAELPETNTDVGAWAQPLRATLVGDVRAPLLLLLAAVATVLLIVCANVAGLLLARGAHRAREMAVRSALGAGRGRIARQAITESSTLALLGGAAGVLGGGWALGLLERFLPADLPRQSEIVLDGRIVLVMLGVTLLAALTCGLLPALQATRIGRPGGLAAGRGTESAARRRAQSVLVVGEVALAVVLTAAAGLLVTSFARMVAVDRGFQPERLLAVGLDLPTQHDGGDDPVPVYERIAARVARIPGVESAAIGLTHPLEPRGLNLRVLQPQGLPDAGEVPQTVVRMVGPGYFRTSGIPLLEGRTFSDADRQETAGVAVVNDAFVRAWFDGASPVGQTFELPWRETGSTIQIVGVVGDVTTDLGRDPLPALYFSHRQIAGFGMRLVVRCAGDPNDLLPAVREAIWDVAPGAPLQDLAPMQQMLAAQVAAPRFGMQLVAGFAAIALSLACIGTYGLMSFSVARRTQEIGIRQALGARTGRILRMVLRESLALTAAGILLGVVAASALGRVIGGMLFGVAPNDPVVLGLVALAVAGVALLAALIPARRATRVDPVVALGQN